MRLATFNVLHGRSLVDDRVDLDRFAAAVRALDADVLALQEVDRGQPRSGQADLTSIAAEACGAVAATFAPALEGLPGAWSKAADSTEGGPSYGVALVSRYPVSSWRVVRLPALPGRVPVVFRGRRRVTLVDDEPRVAVVAEVEAPGGRLLAVSTHLSFLRGWNRLQLGRVLALLRDAPRVVLMGDLNMGPAAAVRATGLRPLATGLTFPGHDPREQLDHLLGRGLHPVGPGVVRPLPVSDHAALTVEVAD